MPDGLYTFDSLEPAPLAARIAAFLLDWAVGFGLALAAALVSWLWLLWQSDGGASQPSDGAVYVALFIATIWLPVWAAVTVAGWVRNGRSPGLAAMALAVCDRSGRPPSAARGIVRILVLAVGSVALCAAPILLVAAIAAAAQGTLPLVVAGVVGLTTPLGGRRAALLRLHFGAARTARPRCRHLGRPGARIATCSRVKREN